MKCGVGIIYNNEADLDRFEAVVDEGATDRAVLNGDGNGDLQLWEDEHRIGDMVEPLGFDSIFAYEHHFSPYVHHPAPLQWLAYWAGRTERIGVGTMLLILPWHNPIRLAEELVQLQYMLNGRHMTIGIGRGLGMREYSGLDVPMDESRERFREGIEILQTAISQEAFSYHGKYFKAPNEEQRSGKMSLRPRPRDAQGLLDSLYGGWLSPPSASTVAELGLNPIIIPNREMATYVDDLRTYAKVRDEAGFAPTHSCVTNAWVFCGESEAECDEIRGYMQKTGVRSFDVNYEMSKGYHSGVPGYEFYGEMAKQLVNLGVESPSSIEAVTMQQSVQTPDKLIENIQTYYDWYTQDGCIPPKEFVFTFNRWSIPFEKAEKSMRLFAKEVLPFVKELKVLDV